MRLYPFLPFSLFKKGITVFKFTKSTNLKDWIVVNDSVMGGVSSSKISFDENEILIFLKVIQKYN